MAFQLDNEAGSLENTRKNHFISEINMTPFVDVCLVLLIIFMVTAPFAISGVNIQLPTTSQSKPLSMSKESLILSINKNGDYFIGKEFIKDANLVTVLKNSVKGKDHPSIFIRADNGVPYGKVMAAMSAAQKAGIERIGMVGENKRDKK